MTGSFCLSWRENDECLLGGKCSHDPYDAENCDVHGATKVCELCLHLMGFSTGENSEPLTHCSAHGFENPVPEFADKDCELFEDHPNAL